MAIHTSPRSAVSEIDALDSVHSDVVSRWHIEDVLIMGDFNADCSYVTKSKSSKLKLRSAKYYWWIGDDVDTTVAATDCAYDRLRFISVSLAMPLTRWQHCTVMFSQSLSGSKLLIWSPGDSTVQCCLNESIFYLKFFLSTNSSILIKYKITPYSTQIMKYY